jgi:hypothetical protein
MATAPPTPVSTRRPRGPSSTPRSHPHSPSTRTEFATDDDLSRPLRQPPRIVSESGRDARRFRELCAKVEDNKAVIERLMAENAALSDEVARCKAKVASYPTVKRRYDRLSRSLSQIAESRAASRRTRSVSKSPV